MTDGNATRDVWHCGTACSALLVQKPGMADVLRATNDHRARPRIVLLLLLVACCLRLSSCVHGALRNTTKAPRKPQARPQRRRRCTREAARLKRAEPVNRALSGHERCKLQGLVHLEIACRKDSNGQWITERHWLLVRQISLPIGQNGWAVDSRQTRGLAYATEFGWEFESTSERPLRAANPPRWSSNPP